MEIPLTAAEFLSSQPPSRWAVAAQGFLDLPIHPIFVHFPIALLTIAWVLIICGHISDQGSERFFALVQPFELLGVVGFAPTVITGFRDAGWWEFVNDLSPSQPLFWHVLAGLATTTVFTAHAIWRHDRVIYADAIWIDIMLSTTGFWLLVMTGLLAGEVVFG